MKYIFIFFYNILCIFQIHKFRPVPNISGTDHPWLQKCKNCGKLRQV